MSSKPSDVLATVFLWVCFCICSLIVFKGLFGDEKPSAPPTTLSHHHIEPQAVLPQPLWSFDLPPPRERPEPTFEPRPEPAPLPRRSGLIPRTERRVRPAVPPGRRVQRERPLAEMSTRERVAAAEKEAAKEAHAAQREQERHWRGKAAAHEEAKAESKRQAASGTGGEAVSADLVLANENGAHDRASTASRDVNASSEDAKHSQETTDKASDTLTIEKGNIEQETLANTTSSTQAIEDGHSERKQLNINLEAADSFSGKTQDIKIVRPAYEGSNAFTGTALGGNNNTSYAPPMDIDGAEDAAQPLIGDMQDAIPVTSDNTITTTENHLTNPLLKENDETARDILAHGLRNLAERKEMGRDPRWDIDLLQVYTSWGEWVTHLDTVVWDKDRIREADVAGLKYVIEEEYKSINIRHGKSSSGELAHVLAVIEGLGNRMAQAYPQLCFEAPEGHVAPDQQTPGEGQVANDEGFAGDEQLYREQQIASDRMLAESFEQQPQDAHVDQQVDMQDYQETAVPSSSGAAPSNVQNGQAGLQINVSVLEPPLESWVNPKQLGTGSLYGHFISPATATFPQSQQQSSAAPVQPDQQRVGEVGMQEPTDMAQTQSQHRPQTPPAVEDDDDDLYGNDAIGEEQQKARKLARAEAERKATSANEAKPKSVQATEQEPKADTLMEEAGQDAQPNPAPQQQPATQAVEPRQQAPASSATNQQPQRVISSLQSSRWNTQESNMETDRPVVPDKNFEADSRMKAESQNAQPEAAVHQQHVGDPFQSHQQAAPAPLANYDALSATGRTTQVEPQQIVTEAAKVVQQASISSATIEQRPRANAGLLRRLGNARQNNGVNGKRNRNRPQPQTQPQPQPVAEAPKPSSPLGARVIGTASIKGDAAQWLTRHEVTDALDMNWTYQDIDPNDNHHPLSTSKDEEANLVLIKTWLEQNNDCVDDLRRRLEAPEFADKDEIEQYTLLLDQMGVKPKIKQISDRYQQLRNHACIQCGDTQVYDWQDYCISPGEIRQNGLQTLASKDLSFLSDLRDAVQLMSEFQDDSSSDNTDYNLVFEAYEIVLSVSRSMRHIIAPSQIAVPTSGPLAGDDSDLSDVDDPGN